MKVGSISRSAPAAGESARSSPPNIVAARILLSILMCCSLPASADTDADDPAQGIGPERIIAVGVVEEGRRFVEDIVDVDIDLIFPEHAAMRKVPRGMQVHRGPGMDIVTTAGNIAVGV